MRGNTPALGECRISTGMSTPELARPWAPFVAGWEANGHQGPLDQFPEKASEIDEGILWCRRCCRLIFARGGLSRASAIPCVPGRIEMRAFLTTDSTRKGRPVSGLVQPLGGRNASS
jgi:hypothetical protein